MALNRQQRERIIAERLLTKHLKNITQEEFATLINELNPGQWRQVQEALVSGTTKKLGDILYRLTLGKAQGRANAEARAAWADGALSESEFDRAFE